MQTSKTMLCAQAPERPGRLYWLDRAGQIKTALLRDKLTLGRTGAGAALEVESGFVSARHGEFALLDGACFYRDTGSTNGTWVNGVKLGADAPRTVLRLEDGDILRIGRPDTPEAQDNVVLLYATHYPENPRWLTLVPPPDACSLEIGRALGSAEAPGLRLCDETISARHCVLYRTMQGWAVENRSATNPITLNGAAPAGPAALRPGDVVRMANSYLICGSGRFYLLDGTPGAPLAAETPPPPPQRTAPQAPAMPAAPAPAARPVPPAVPEVSAARPAAPVVPAGGSTLAVHIVRRSAKHWRGRVDLLKDISLAVNSGEMVLILGGSGAGKTTFLNAVMGYEPAEGSIRFGEVDLYRDYEQMKHEIGFVPQEDLLRGSDSVQETLHNAAQMKLPALPEAERQTRVRDVLVLFGLEREGDKLVSKLSGGQRKRLSIAVEYIGNPSLFFLDEPDSGLDGVMARSLMENLRFIADSGKIVLVITHGPDRAADLFDKVVVLAKSEADNCGHLAFFGTLPDARAFFGAPSMEGVVKKINRPDEGGEGRAEEFIRAFAARQEREGAQ